MIVCPGCGHQSATTNGHVAHLSATHTTGIAASHAAGGRERIAADWAVTASTGSKLAHELALPDRRRTAPDGAPGAWRDRAACRPHPTAWWFPERGEIPEQAWRICASCPVRADCLDHAVDHRETHGVWGGLGERQRRKLRRARLLEQPA